MEFNKNQLSVLMARFIYIIIIFYRSDRDGNESELFCQFNKMPSIW